MSLDQLTKVSVPQGRTGARNFLAMCCKEIGLGFHPDTPFSDYVDQYGARIFTDKQARKLERCLRESVAIFNAMSKDVYSFCMETEPFQSMKRVTTVLINL